MAKEYTHNGAKVLFQYCDEGTNFLDVLHENGIVPQELPDLEHRVFIYNDVGGKTIFALMESNLYSQQIYITDTLPMDGWDALVFDVDEQRGNEKPATMKSRLALAADAAHDAAMREIEKKYELGFFDLSGVNDYDHLTEEQKQDYRLIFGIEMANYGYHRSMLDKIFLPEEIDINRIIEFLHD